MKQYDATSLPNPQIKHAKNVEFPLNDKDSYFGLKILRQKEIFIACFGAGREPFFTTLSSEVEVPPNYVPSPPLCSTCGGRGYWKLSRIDSQRSWHHLYVCDSCSRYSKLVTPPDVAQFEIPVHVD